MHANVCIEFYILHLYFCTARWLNLQVSPTPRAVRMLRPSQATQSTLPGLEVNFLGE